MLQVIIGPMFSGKTSHAIAQCRQYRAIGKKVVFINHVSDKRYNSLHVTSHDGINEACISTDNLSTLVNHTEYRDAHLVIIEEAQFFTGLVAFIQQVHNNDEQQQKDVIVVGLNCDFQKNKMGEILDVIPLADTVTHLTGLCNQCKDGTRGPFTRRKGNDQTVIMVGEHDLYECVCRKHHTMTATIDSVTSKTSPTTHYPKNTIEMAAAAGVPWTQLKTSRLDTLFAIQQKNPLNERIFGKRW